MCRFLLAGMLICSVIVMGCQQSEEPVPEEIGGWTCLEPEDAAMVSTLLLVTTWMAHELAAMNAVLMSIPPSAPALPDLFEERVPRVENLVSVLESWDPADRWADVHAEITVGVNRVRTGFAAARLDFPQEEPGRSRSADPIFAATNHFQEAGRLLLDACFVEEG